MSWIPLTLADLKGAMTPDEVADFGTANADGDPDDRATEVLAALVSEIRGNIASNKQNTLSEDDTLIPQSFKRHALSLARYQLLITIPGYDPGKPRTDAKDSAEAFFMNVAKGLIRPEAAEVARVPDVPTERPAGAQWTAAGSRTGRQRMNGL